MGDDRGGRGLAGRRILVGLTGSIAVYKAADWVLALSREEARVRVIMTRAATAFVSSMTFSALSGHNVYTELFDEGAAGSMAHIHLARETDLVLVAPATAQTIARLAHGLADDLLSTTILATRAPVVVCPAMNSRMLSHPATQDNLERLRRHGHVVLAAPEGPLACGEEGAGRLCSWDTAREAMLRILSSRDLEGRTVLVTSGPTVEPLDPARFISNPSSGRMGHALARAARRRGARVILVSGPTALDDPPGVDTVRVRTALEMYEAVMARAAEADIIIKAAAVSDFRPKTRAAHKIKKQGAPLVIELEPNPDILAELGRRRRPGQVLVGFAAESRDHLAEARRKLEAKGADLVVVNDIAGPEGAFASADSAVTLVSVRGEETLPRLPKETVAERILDACRPFLSSPAASS